MIPDRKSADRAAGAGELSHVGGHSILTLSGDDLERGFAQGYLLANETLECLQSMMLGLISPKDYESSFLPWIRATMDWDARSQLEIKGIFDGIRARIDNPTFNGRPLRREDVIAVNCIADYVGVACSGFATWGSRTGGGGGGIVHARTLDYPVGAAALANQLIFVNKPTADCNGFVAVGWPGSVAQYTMMNHHGVSGCLHDAYNASGKGFSDSYTQRGILLRRIMEKVGAKDTLSSARSMADPFRVTTGNLFHFSWPSTEHEGGTIAAGSGVIEFDPARPHVARQNDKKSEYIVVTNHFTEGYPPTQCPRSKSMSDMLDSTPWMGLAEAQRVLAEAEQDIAAHSVYFFPEKREFCVSMTSPGMLSTRSPAAGYSMASLIGASK